MDLQIHPVTPERWADFEKLFGAKGACAGCWCMFFRQDQKTFDAGRGEPNRLAMKAIIEAGETPGLLAYDGGVPVGWAAVAPRTAYARLQRSRTLKPVDDQPVWSIPCFFVAKRHRRKGITVALLNAAAAYVKEKGGTVLEGYPESRTDQMVDTFAYMGIQRAFARAGFEEVARPSPVRVIMRRYL